MKYQTMKNFKKNYVTKKIQRNKSKNVMVKTILMHILYNTINQSIYMWWTINNYGYL